MARRQWRRRHLQGALLAGMSLFLLPMTVLSSEVLPFPNGTYASEQAFCEMNREDVPHEWAYIDLEEDTVHFWDGGAEIQDVQVDGDVIWFTGVFNVEGEEEIGEMMVRKISATSFEIDDTRYVFCGRQLPW
jgi:hypothetical protein